MGELMVAETKTLHPCLDPQRCTGNYVLVHSPELNTGYPGEKRAFEADSDSWRWTARLASSGTTK